MVFFFFFRSLLQHLIALPKILHSQLWPRVFHLTRLSLSLSLSVPLPPFCTCSLWVYCLFCPIVNCILDRETAAAAIWHRISSRESCLAKLIYLRFIEIECKISGSSQTKILVQHHLSNIQSPERNIQAIVQWSSRQWTIDSRWVNWIEFHASISFIAFFITLFRLFVRSSTWDSRTWSHVCIATLFMLSCEHFRLGNIFDAEMAWCDGFNKGENRSGHTECHFSVDANRKIFHHVICGPRQNLLASVSHLAECVDE